MSNINIGNSFPLEKLDSDLSRNNYNYESILNGLIKWNNTSDDTVTIRLTKDTSPWYEDYVIPSKHSTLNNDLFTATISGSITANSFSEDNEILCSVSGGSKIIIETTFDASNYSTTNSDEISLTDADNFNKGDIVKFSTSDGTLPDELNAGTLYYIVTKENTNVITVSENENSTGIVLKSGSGTIIVSKFQSTLDADEADKGDIVTFRITVTSNGNCTWKLYYAPIIYSFESGTIYKANNYVLYNSTLYRTIFDSSSTDLITYSSVFRPLISTWTYGTNYYKGDIVIDSDNGNTYLVLADISNSGITPANDTDDFEQYADVWVSGTDYVKGNYIYYNGQFYLAINDITDSILVPSSDTTNWESILLFKITSFGSITSSTVVRWYADKNVSGFYLRNEDNVASNSTTNIYIQASVKTIQPSSIYQRTTGLYYTTNYAMWPDNSQTVWTSGFTYGPTDITIPINKRQTYSASMIFDHTRTDLSKTVNYINYEGPDLDQGLCIYLPVEVNTGDNGIAYPEDGFTFDFFFRIWPNSSLNGSVTRDHTVNKSQIYVYSVKNRDNIENDICENPIAKFSMARTTNFYVFNENISIPDKPVCYRATFIYSSAEKRWILYNYYQLPDHIFVGPVGFIDPQVPGNNDINSDSVGINPNAKFIGYETAAFPLFQDPFSNTDLTPYRLKDDDDYDSFKNRTL